MREPRTKIMRRFFQRLIRKKGGRHRARGETSREATGNDDVEVSEELPPATEPCTNEPGHTEAGHAEVDAEEVVQHANLHVQNVQVNQEIDTLIQHADEVHAEVVHAENVGTIQAGVLHQHIHQPPVPKPNKEDVDKLVKEFCDNVKERSWEETSGGVADSYREQNLTEPEKEFSPQLKKIKFYRGDWVPKKKKTLTGIQRRKRIVAKKRPEQQEMSQEHNQDLLQYVKEDFFALEENHKEGKDISKHEILHFIEKQKYATGEAEWLQKTQRFKAIVGQAGSGKTTLMKRLARDVIHGKLMIQKGQNEAFKPEFVHYLNIRDIPVSKKITPCDLLFGKVMPKVKNDSINYGFEWLQNNQDRAVFFLDGLDQATWSLQGNSNPIRYEDKASTSTVMENLLEGNLFPNVPIIISSREHALTPLTGNLRPHEIIGLAGFTMEDRKQVFIGLAGEDGENLWNLMCTKSPVLVPLASIPIFLVFIVIIYKFDPENPPDTMSGVMTEILQIFLQSDHAHERENIMEILEALKEMSFKGTEEGKVLFTHKDLKEFNLILKRVRDLVVFVPGSTLLGKNLMEGHYRLFFCHQSIQELLSALCIIEKDLKEFTTFANNSLHEDHWSVVRRFVCGVLLNEETYNDAKAGDLIDVSDVNKKRKILKQSLRERLQSSTGQYRQQLELFASLYESNDSEFIQSNVHEINIERQPLTPNDMHAISSLLRRCFQVDRVRLEQCSLNYECFDILNTGLQGSQVQINRFDVSNNGDIVNDTFIVLCSIIRQCQVKNFVMDGCQIQEVDGNSHTTVGRLVIAGRKLGVEEMSALGSALQHYDKMNEVTMTGCELQEDGMKCFMDAVAHIKIKILDVGWNQNMGRDGCETIGAIVHRCQVEQLKMPWCKLSKDEIKVLQGALTDSKIKILEYSLPFEHSCDYVQAIADLVHRCHLQKFVLWRSSLLSFSDKDLIKRKAADTEIVFK